MKKSTRLFSEGNCRLTENRFPYLVFADWGKFQHIYRFFREFSCCEKEKVRHLVEVFLKDSLEGETWQYYLDSKQFLKPTTLRKITEISQRKALISRRIQSFDEYLPSAKSLHNDGPTTGSP